MFLTYFSSRILQINNYLSSAKSSTPFDYSNSRIYAFARLQEITAIAYSLSIGGFLTEDEFSFIDSQCKDVHVNFGLPESLHPLDDFRFVRGQFGRRF